MRYSDRITFVFETEGGYNPDTGNHDEAVITMDIQPCNISPIGVDRSVQLFGEIDTGIIVTRLQRPYHKPISYVEIPEGQYEGKYRIKEQVRHRPKTVFYLEGVHS